jgi:hypothetical protein
MICGTDHYRRNTKSVVVATGENSDLVGLNLINYSMFLLNSTRPAALQFVPKRFRLSESSEGVPLNVLNQINDAKSFLAILLNPLRQVFEGIRIKFQASHKLPQLEFRFRDL